MEKIVQFDVGNVCVSDDFSNEDFAILDIDIASTVPNSHGLVFTKDSLTECGKSFFLKPILGKYDKYRRDMEAHEPDEDTFGGFFNKDSIQVIDKPDGSHLVAKGFLWKNYCANVIDMIQRRQDVAVSMEIALKDYDEDTGLVKKFVGKGCTLLGLSVRPSIPTSHATLVSFSEMKSAYDKDSGNMGRLRKLSNVYMEKNHKVNPSIKAIYDGDWDGEKVKDDLIKEPDFLSLAPKVCMLLEEGWKNKEKTKLKYPVMILHNGEWVYSRRGLASALAYAKKGNEKAVISKVEDIYGKLKLDGKEEMSKMAEIEGRKAWGEVIRQVEDHEGKGAYVESIEDNHIIFKKDDKRFVVEAKIEVGKDDKMVHADIKWDTVKEDEDQKEDDKEDKKEDLAKKDKEEKKMSANENVDGAAVAEYLEKEAKYNELLAKEYINGDNKEFDDKQCEDKLNECMCDMLLLADAPKFRAQMGEEKFAACVDKMCGLAREVQDVGSVYMAKNEELRKFKEDSECAQRMADIEDVLSETDCFSEQEKKEFADRAKGAKPEEMSALKNEVKAKAFEKGNKDGKVATKNFSRTQRVQLWADAENKDKGIWD